MKTGIAPISILLNAHGAGPMFWACSQKVSQEFYWSVSSAVRDAEGSMVVSVLSGLFFFVMLLVIKTLLSCGLDFASLLVGS
jgi:hypothetical protein